MNDNNEIVNITPDNIKSISVITSPGSEYDAEVESVILSVPKSAVPTGSVYARMLWVNTTNGYLITKLSTPGIRPRKST